MFGQGNLKSSSVTVIKIFRTRYRCFVCKRFNCNDDAAKELFKITKLEDFFAPHGIIKGPNKQLLEWKLLKCPGCKKREKCYRGLEHEEAFIS